VGNHKTNVAVYDKRLRGASLDISNERRSLSKRAAVPTSMSMPASGMLRGCDNLNRGFGLLEFFEACRTAGSA
jgi:hypothetical protein